MVPGSGNRALDLRADVEANRVVREFGSVPKGEAPAIGVKLFYPAGHEFNGGTLGKPRHVDLHFVAPVVPGDEAGKHPGIELPRVGRDECDARAVQRAFRQFAQHHKMRMAGTGEYEALHAFCSLPSSRLRSSLRCTLPVVVIGSASINSISRGYS